MNYDTFTIGTTDYKKNFWDKAMKGNIAPYEIISKGATKNDMFVLPYDSNRKYMDTLKKECLFRRIATSVNATTSDANLWVSTCDDPAEWAQDNPMETIKECVDVFEKKRIQCHKLAIITRMDNDFLADVSFDMEDYLTKHFAKRFGKAEEDAFVNGTGVQMPIGILHETDGAQTGVETDAITFDDVMDLYFSVDAQYRTDGVWVMNDETARFLHTLKDNDGNYLWNHNSNTIMGKEVHICNYMPSTGSGSKPIAFGDFSYYWIVNRMPISVRALGEKFALNQQIGYIAHEYLDAKLIRTEAIKVIAVN